MKRLLVTLPLCLFAGSALAQEVPPAVYQDLWCATAYRQTIIVEAMPPADQPRAQIFYDAAAKLLDRAVAGLQTAGFSAENIDRLKQNLVLRVANEVKEGGSPQFAPAECDALLVELLPPEVLAEQSSAQ